MDHHHRYQAGGPPPPPNQQLRMDSDRCQLPNQQAIISLPDNQQFPENLASAPRPPLGDRQESTDRKRRHTGVEHERRYHLPRHYIDHMAGPSHHAGIPEDQLAGGSHGGNIDLTSPSNISTSRPLPPPPPRPPHHDWNPHMSPDSASNFGPRFAEVPLPRWQPDSEASKCPICETEFTFWYRKHHCRKCGRVVCSACSPHRITIPRQYIVQHPHPYLEAGDEEEGEEDADNGTSFSGAFSNGALFGGGEVVRVCNPCVPDPWTPTAAGQSRPPAPGSMRSPPGVQRVASLGRDRHEDHAFSGAPHQWPDRRESSHGRHRSYSHQIAPTPQHDGGPTGIMRPDFFAASGQPITRLNRSNSRYYAHRAAHSISGGGSSSSSNMMLPPLPGHPHGGRPHPSLPLSGSVPFIPGVLPPPPPPRRQVREEDECPVCGIEMPPGETVREAHVQECIANRFSSTPTQRSQAQQPSPSTPVAATPSATDHSSSINALSSAGPSSPPPPHSLPSASRPRAASYRPRGMAVYRATEKDCVTEDDEPQECVICFEEFHPGDELGRMECLCKFHRTCIRQWWDTKGTGSCPTHQLHD